ncbi:MAG: uridine kinase family protein [Tepidanaerobacteraceae bacterium]
MNIRNVLLSQYRLYPMMQIRDIVKLIYQNEFAGEHLILNEKDSLLKLQKEYNLIKCKSATNTIYNNVFEEIGNGLCRLNLFTLKDYDIDLTTVNRFFLTTANSNTGSKNSFENKLDVFSHCCRKKELPYDPHEVVAYLLAYRKKGYPPVSHSNIYKIAYSPAYRIVKKDYSIFFELFCKIDLLMKSHKRVIVAIDGNSGAGKTTLASLIGSIYDCNTFHMDDFFLTPDLKTEKRLKEIGGNVDYVRFKQEVIDKIHSGHKFDFRAYDCKKMAFKQPVSVIPKKLNIIEGCYSMHPTLINNYDLKIFLCIDKEKQIQLILKRNGVDVLNKYLEEWIPLENKYFEEYKIKERSDLVFNR